MISKFYAFMDRPDPIKILERKFYATLFLQAFRLATQFFQPIRKLKKYALCKIYAVISL